MPQTVIGSEHFRTIWAQDVFVEAKERMFYNRTGMMGRGEDAVIQEITNLSKEKGDTINYTLRMNLNGSGVTGDATLVGNEEQLVFQQDSITISQLRNAVRSPGRFEEKRTAFNVREHMRSSLVTWLAETMDLIIFDHLCGRTAQTFPAAALAPSSNRRIFAGTATAESGLTDNPEHRLTVEEISRARLEAELATPMVRPIMVDGQPHYIMVMHPRQAYHLHYSGTGTIARMWEQGQREAMERGRTNPLFTGALGLWDGVILRAHRQVPLFTTGASSSNVARAILLGAQAGVIAFGSAPTWGEEEFDYGNSLGVGYGQIFGVKKTRFDGQDFGLITVATSAAAIAGTSHT